MGYLVDVPIDIVSKWWLNGSLIWFYRDNHGLFMDYSWNLVGKYRNIRYQWRF